MSTWYWRVIALKTAFVLTCFASFLRADDHIQKLPFCNSDTATVNDLVLVSTLDGKLTAFTTQNGIKAWHVETQPLLSSNLHHVELTAGGKWVRLVPSLSGTLYSLSGETIEPLPFDADQLLSSSFKYSDDLVIAGARETQWLGVDARTGGLVYECGGGGCSGEQRAAGVGRELLVLRRHSNTVRALDPRTGAEKWNFSVAEHQLALSRRDCAGGGGGGGGPPVNMAIALPEGTVAVLRPGDHTPMWQQQLEAPVAGVWRLHDGVLQHIDVLWEATRPLLDTAAVQPPSLYIGVHNRQLYIQESLLYAQKIETAVSTKPVPWKVLDSRPLPDQTALQLQQPDSNTLSLVTLYGNTHLGNHGFFLYLQETCNNEIQTVEEESVAEQAEAPQATASEDQHHHVHVHVYSLWFWWKEVVLIAISSALLMNLMIWPRFFAPKTRSPTPLPINQEYIVVERHYERAATPAKVDYSGRYENDFTPVRCLGKGGFGVVFEAKNNIDHCSYAVKRITLPNRKSKRDRVLREVRVLAKLEHEHIVRYFNAWVEEPPPHWQEQRDALIARNLAGASVLLSDKTNTPATEGGGARGARGARGDSVLLNMNKPIDACVDALYFDKSLTESKRHRSLSCNESISVLSDEDGLSPSLARSYGDTRPTSTDQSPPNTLHRRDNQYDESSSIVFEAADASEGLSFHKPTKTLNNTTTSKKKKQKGHTRHWSLDMCVKSEESPLPAPATKMYLYIQMQLCCRDNLHDWLLLNHTWESRGGKVKSLFSQIVSAVEYVHRAGLIHRDLKPSNILFAPDGRVKVGDFGLVTTMRDDSDDEIPAEVGAPQHTNRVGTELYMSPEQRRGQKYGFKVDIYSMGLILFELYHPCATDAERVACLRDARAGRYPPAFRDKHPHEVEVLSLMLSEDPDRRPTARALRSRAPLNETEETAAG